MAGRKGSQCPDREVLNEPGTRQLGGVKVQRGWGGGWRQFLKERKVEQAQSPCLRRGKSKVDEEEVLARSPPCAALAVAGNREHKKRCPDTNKSVAGSITRSKLDSDYRTLYQLRAPQFARWPLFAGDLGLALTAPSPGASRLLRLHLLSQGALMAICSPAGCADSWPRGTCTELAGAIQRTR